MVSIYTLISGVLILSMGIFVLCRNVYSKINIVFSLFTLSAFVWLFCFSFMYMSVDKNVALAWAKIGDIGILYLPIFAYYFVIVFLNINMGIYRSVLRSAFILSVPILLLSQTDYFFIGIRTYNWGHYPLAGPFYVFLIMFFSLFMACIPILYFSLRNSLNYSVTKLQQIQYVLYAFIGACTGFVDYLPKYNISIYPWGHLSTLVFISLIAYAILKHHLMDINVVIKRSIYFILGAGFLTVSYFMLICYSNILIKDGIVQMPLKTIYVVSAFIALVLHLFLGVIVLMNNKHKTLNRVFACLSLFIFIWVAGCFIQSITRDPLIALVTERIVSKFYVFAPALFLHTFLEAAKVKKQRLLLFSYIFAGFLFLLSFYPIFIDGVTYVFGARFVTNPGSLFFLFPLSIIINACFALLNILRARRDAVGQLKLQLGYLLVSGCFIVAAVFFSNLLIYKVIFTPFDEMLNVVYGVTIGYAILSHHLMDINVVIRKGLIYSLLAGLLSAIYLSAVFLFGNYLGGRNSSSSIIFTVLSIIIFSIIFQPLRDRIQTLIDKVFFRGKYDYQKTLKELSHTIGGMGDLDEMLNKVLTTIISVIKIKSASVYVLDKKTGHYFARKAINSSMPVINSKDPLIGHLMSNEDATIYEEPDTKYETALELRSVITFPMTAKNILLGFLNLGEKLSGEVYSDEDIDLLTTICSQIGVSIENAMLYEEALDSQKRLAQADKLATVGALAAGLAHEIKNPIAAIKGFAQVLDKAIDENDAEALNDFKKVVPKQLDRINNIVENLLRLSKPQKNEKKKVNINSILEDIVKLLDKQAMKQQVKIIRSFGVVPDTTADPEGLTQAFLNLILNAMQSMPDGGDITIKTSANDDKSVVIEVSDTGLGIPKDKLSKIFDPFFTTKPEGSGLGLSSANKTILDHHGNIKVASVIGKGTIFTVTLPIV